MKYALARVTDAAHGLGAVRRCRSLRTRSSDPPPGSMPRGVAMAGLCGLAGGTDDTLAGSMPRGAAMAAL